MLLISQTDATVPATAQIRTWLAPIEPEQIIADPLRRIASAHLKSYEACRARESGQASSPTGG